MFVNFQVFWKTYISLTTWQNDQPNTHNASFMTVIWGSDAETHFSPAQGIFGHSRCSVTICWPKQYSFAHGSTGMGLEHLMHKQCPTSLDLLLMIKIEISLRVVVVADKTLQQSLWRSSYLQSNHSKSDNFTYQIRLSCLWMITYCSNSNGICLLFPVLLFFYTGSTFTVSCIASLAKLLILPCLILHLCCQILHLWSKDDGPKIEEVTSIMDKAVWLKTLNTVQWKCHQHKLMTMQETVNKCQWNSK